jgi:hypothetical protein
MSCNPAGNRAPEGPWEDLLFPEVFMTWTVSAIADAEGAITVVNDEWSMGLGIIAVRQYPPTGTTWKELGTLGTTAVFPGPKMYIDRGNVPVVRYLSDDAGTVLVRRWVSGTSWESYPELESLGVNVIDLGFDSDNNLVIVYLDHAQDDRVHVQHWNGLSWDDYGLASAGAAAVPVITVSEGGVFVGFVDGAAAETPRVVRHAGGTAWTDYGFPGPSMANGRDQKIHLAVDMQSRPVVYLMADWASVPYSSALVARWNTGTGWDTLGSLGSGSVPGDRSFFLDVDDGPLAVASEINDACRVFRYQSGTLWEDWGLLGSGDVFYASIVNTPANKPVAAFIDADALHVLRRR